MNRAVISAWLGARCLRVALLAIALAAGAVQAQPIGDEGIALTGTLATLRQRGSVIIGYREASVPFSFLSTLKQPVGYSIELCKELVADLGEAVQRELKIEWQPVTSANRVDAVVSGRIDLECGSTTNNAERRERVAFSPTIFVAGTKLMVKQGSAVRSFKDLAGQRAAVTAGTTNEQVMRDLSDKFALKLQFIVSTDHDQSLARLLGGEADAFATDDVLLYGFIAQRKLQGQVKVVGDLLSYDPYGVMYRRDDPLLARVVNLGFQRLARDGEIERQYRRWFLRKLPLGVSLDLPMSAQLEALIAATARPTE
ncbi:MAG TPA: amino acid ABC transporter substrate-binding protein [Rubrivivax sp.]|nr:amino acid ABC transporter substrate-binding protein [Rubrivivax sp.]